MYFVFARKYITAVSLLCCVVIFFSQPAMAGWLDPFWTNNTTAPSPAGNLSKDKHIQGTVPHDTPLSLSEVVEYALYNNPQTRSAWMSARAQAAQVGVSYASYLPSISLSTTDTWSEQRVNGAASGSNTNQQGATASLNYLLFDFGVRESNVENSKQVLVAANATHNATVQKVFLSAVQAYFQYLAAQETVRAAKEAEKAASESFNAASARYSIGASTPADKLQAQTAYSQATLTRIQAEGNANIARGVLANVMGLSPDYVFVLAPFEVVQPDGKFEQEIDKLMLEARKQRPDLLAATAQLNATRAGLSALNSSRLPSLSLFGSYGYSNNANTNIYTNTFSYGLSLSFPLFTGFASTYRVAAAEAQLDSQSAQQQLVEQQVALDVWKGYQSLVTNTEAVKTSFDLLSSASRSEDMARGRYQAGAGSIIDLLTAQTALASARQQNIQAIYNWYIARVTLAQAIGRLDFSTIDFSSKNDLK